MLRIFYLVFTFLFAKPIEQILGLLNNKTKKRIIGLKSQKNTLQKYKNCILIHCASLGEYEMAVPIIKELRQKTNSKLVVSFTSPSGYEKAEMLEQCTKIYLPADGPLQISKFINQLEPSAFVLIKYEFWLNLLTTLNRRNIPIFLLSSTLRPNHFLTKWVGKPWINELKKFKILGFQNTYSLEIAKSLGLTNAVLNGDMRFNRVQEIAQQKEVNSLLKEFAANNKVLILGSSWQAEEECLAKCMHQLAAWKIIIAPHDIGQEHIKQIKSLFTQATLYTQGNSNSNVLILDTIGQLKLAYKYATVAVIGGGFTGALHNILEPLAWSVPVVFGPNNSKFWEAKDAIKNGLALEFTNENELMTAINYFENKVISSTKWILNNQVSTSAIAEQILSFIPDKEFGIVRG